MSRHRIAQLVSQSARPHTPPAPKITTDTRAQQRQNRQGQAPINSDPLQEPEPDNIDPELQNSSNSKARTARNAFRENSKHSNVRDEYGKQKGSYSTRTQWQEKISRPIAARPMNSSDVAEFQGVLSIPEGVDVSEITWRFYKIMDHNDEDRHDCLLLVYFAPRLIRGKLENKPIWRIKVPISAEAKANAEKKMRETYRKTAPKRRRGGQCKMIMGSDDFQYKDGKFVHEDLEEDPPESFIEYTPPVDDAATVEPKPRTGPRKPIARAAKR